MGQLNFNMRDLYPAIGIAETSTEVIPDVNDMDALNEDVKTAGAANNYHARGKFMLIAVAVILAVIFMLGGAK